MGVQILHGKGYFWGGRHAPICPMTVQKMAEPIDLLFGLWTRVGRKMHKFSHFARWRQCAHMGGHIGVTWRIWLNRLSAAAMRPYVKLLWSFVIITGYVVVVGLLFTGEGLRFIAFVVKYPSVLIQLITFSLCSAIGQVTLTNHS